MRILALLALLGLAVVVAPLPAPGAACADVAGDADEALSPPVGAVVTLPPPRPAPFVTPASAPPARLDASRLFRPPRPAA